MEQEKIGIYNYLDENAVINNNIIEVFSLKKLHDVFPDIPQSKLQDFEAEWRAARQRMLNLKFDNEDFK